MGFEIKGKVALVAGGVSGIGLQSAKALLRNGLRGVALADVNDDLGKQALVGIEKEFGPNKAIYVQTDVSNQQSYEDAFKKTIEVFQNLDILINSAGIFNDAKWEKEIAVNLNGVIHGVLLGLENYIPKYKSGEEGIIVNVCSVAGVKDFSLFPIYSATKFAVHGLSRSFGDVNHYNRTKVKVLAICPGATDTPMYSNMAGLCLGPAYEELRIAEVAVLPVQTAESVGLGLVKIIKNAKTGTVWVAEDGKDPYEFILPPRENFAPK